MTTKTDPIAQAQTAADKATKAAQDAHKRAKDAAQALNAAQAERDRTIDLVGSGKAGAAKLAEANHTLTHAQEVAQATADHATEQQRTARLARLAVAQARIDHFADDRGQAVEHMNAIADHIRALLDLQEQRNRKAAETLGLLRAEGVAVGKLKDKPVNEDAGLLIQNLLPVSPAIYVKHPNGRFEVTKDTAGAIVANAIARATEGNPHKLDGRITLVGRYDHKQPPSQVAREVYGS